MLHSSTCLYLCPVITTSGTTGRTEWCNQMPLFNFPWLTKRNCLRWVDFKPIGAYWSLPSLLNPSRTSVTLRGRQMVLWFRGHLGRSRTPYQIHLQSGCNIKLPPPLIIHTVLVSFFGEVKTSETSGYTHTDAQFSWGDCLLNWWISYHTLRSTKAREAFRLSLAVGCFIPVMGSTVNHWWVSENVDPLRGSVWRIPPEPSDELWNIKLVSTVKEGGKNRGLQRLFTLKKSAKHHILTSVFDSCACVWDAIKNRRQGTRA